MQPKQITIFIRMTNLRFIKIKFKKTNKATQKNECKLKCRMYEKKIQFQTFIR